MLNEAVFNHARCAELHNRILDIGWAALHDIPWTQDSRSYWEFWFGEHRPRVRRGPLGDLMFDAGQVDAQVGRELEQRLAPDVLQFLKTAGFDTPGENHDCHFFFGVNGLEQPAMMLSDLNNVQVYNNSVERCLPSEERDRYVTLYSTGYVSRGLLGGILFDQVDMKAITLLDSDNIEIERVGNWVPLEDILSAFVEMIEQGRIGTMDLRQPWRGNEDPSRPWVLTSNIEIPLQRTLEAWDALVLAIEEKLPGNPTSTGAPPETLREIPSDIKGDFVRSFLQQARFPNFKYIAPGLRIPTAADLTSQPFQNWQPLRRPGDQRSYPEFPVLLFPADQSLQTDKRQVYNARGYTWNGYPWHYSDQYETGLYLLPQQTDRCLLLLPFTLGANKKARRGDGTLLVEGYHFPEEKRCNGYEQLYQPGLNHICPGQRVRFELVLKNWRERIVNGDWDVDADGVAGGIEKFREADTAEHWQKYVIPRTW